MSSCRRFSHLEQSAFHLPSSHFFLDSFLESIVHSSTAVGEREVTLMFLVVLSLRPV